MDLLPASPVPAPKKSLRGRFFLAGLLVFAFVIYLVQPGILAWWLRRSLAQQAKDHSWSLTLGKVEADFFSGHALFKDIQLKDERSAFNLAECTELDVDFSAWRLLFHRDQSPLRKIALGKSRIDWTWLPAARASLEGGKTAPSSSRNLFPDEVVGNGISANLECNGTLLVVENADFTFLPNAAGEINIPRFTASHAPWKRSFINLEGVTAIKERGLYIGGVKFAENLILERAGFNFDAPGKKKITADLQFSAFGGEWRTDVDVDRHKPPVQLEAAASFWNLSVNQLGEFFGNPDLAEGTIHEGRLTFRGNPGDAARTNTTLRLNATDFRWHERRWNSLVASAILVNRRIEIPQFDLVQEKNQIQLKGHAELPAKWTQIPPDFQLQVLAQLDDLRSASVLILPNQKDVAGEAFFAGEVRNEKGRFSGNLKMRGGPLQISGVSIDRVRGDLDLRGSEVSATNLEFARGMDKASGWGTLDLAAPRRYSGELDITAGDIANYTAILPKAISDHAVSGGVQLWWSGDGTSGAHSGAFKATLHDFLLSKNGDAVPLDLVSHGSYSPAGIAFNHLTVQRPQIKLDTALLVRQDSLELRDLRIAGSGGSLLQGNLTLPINLLAALNSPNWASLLESKAAASGRITGNKIHLEEICELAGRRLPIHGLINFELSAKGALEALQANLQFSGSDLFGPNQLAIAALHASGSLFAGELDLQGTVNSAEDRDNLTFGFQGTTALSSANLVKGQIFPPLSPVSGSVQTTRLAVGLLHPWIVATQPFSGDVAGTISLAGTASKPEITGQLNFLQTTWQPDWLAYPLQKLSGEVALAQDRLAWKTVAGNYRTGTFSVTGSTGLQPAEAIDLAIEGKKLPISSPIDPSTAIADANVQWVGPQNARSLRGEINFKNAELRREAAVVYSPRTFSAANHFSLPWLIPDWSLALVIRAEQPLVVRGNVASWQMLPDWEISGTAKDPLFQGQLNIWPLGTGKKTTPTNGGIPIYFLKTSLENGLVGDLGSIIPIDSTLNPPLRFDVPSSSTQHLEMWPIP